MQFQNYMPICRLNKNIFGYDNNKSFLRFPNSTHVRLSHENDTIIFFVSNSKMLNIIPTAVVPKVHKSSKLHKKEIFCEIMMGFGLIKAIFIK